VLTEISDLVIMSHLFGKHFYKDYKIAKAGPSIHH